MADDVVENGLYPRSYGAWAGNPRGHAPDYARCCAEVHSGERWARYHQCSRPRGYGADHAYCKQHDPEVVKARDVAARKRSTEKWNADRAQWYGASFLKVLRQIADGHNDARGLAADAVAKFDDGAMKEAAS